MIEFCVLFVIQIVCLFALVALGSAEETKRDKRHYLGSGFGEFFATAYAAPVASAYAAPVASAYAAPVATDYSAPVATAYAAPAVAQTVGINQHTHTHSVERVCAFSLETFKEDILISMYTSLISGQCTSSIRC